MTKQRCAWAESDPLLRQYHDEEWGVPEFDSRALWETLMLEGFQAGLAWIIVLRKREAFRKAFKGFDPKKVARLGSKDVEKMLENPGIIRSRAKIEATIGGAKAFLKMRTRAWSFQIGFGRWRAGSRCKIRDRCRRARRWRRRFSKELKRRGFKFVGPVIVYAWMQAAGIVNDHAEDCFRRASCARVKRKV